MNRIDPEALPHRLDQVPDPTDEPPAEDTTCRRTRRIIGSQSDEEEIAALLRLHGWGTALDGVVGFWTQRALIEFQHANGLDTTGEPDEVTRTLLECVDAAGHTAYLDNPLPPLAGGTPAVLGVQQSLARLGWSLALDGLSGPATRRAIREFQHANGLPVTGAVDDAIAALATMPSARGYREYLSDPLPAAPSRPLSTEDMLAKVEQIVDSVGFDWRQHGVTLAIGCATTTCGGGQYDPRTSTIYINTISFADPTFLRYLVLHELAHAWQFTVRGWPAAADDLAAWGLSGHQGLEAAADCLAAAWGATHSDAYYACPADAVEHMRNLYRGG